MSRNDVRGKMRRRGEPPRLIGGGKSRHRASMLSAPFIPQRPRVESSDARDGVRTGVRSKHDSRTRRWSRVKGRDLGGEAFGRNFNGIKATAERLAFI